MMQRKTGKLGMEQLMQLAWWQEQADNWPVYFSVENTSLFLRCKSCDRSIMACGGYLLKMSEMTSQTVAHLRQFHREIGADGREDAKMGNRNDLVGNRSSDSIAGD
jgi:hypothetical protein